MLKPHLEKFREDVVWVARKPEPGVLLERIAAHFGIHPMTLSGWMPRSDVEDGATPGTTSADQAGLWELKHRDRLLEQENEVLRRATA